MFNRLILQDSAAVFTLSAFVTAVSIFCCIGWRALRMPRPQLQRLENLPFETPTPAADHEPLA